MSLPTKQSGKDVMKEINMWEVSKSDWKLFREKIAGWQEHYMEKLAQDYLNT